MSFSSFKSTPSGYKNEPGAGRIVEGKIYIGIVKNNVDMQRMGRLEVYIPEMGGDPKNTAHWFIVSYASPFAGVSDPSARVANSHLYGESQQSYGWWAVPPDVENQVLVTFVNGEASKGFWFACIYSQNMNHMVPGVAIDNSFDMNGDKSMPPVVEYNKLDPSINTNAPVRPRFDPLAAGLVQQGLTYDFERGSASSSARREAPSRVFGYLTPRANQVYVDDNPDNEFIRLRTRSGTQVLVHETNGYVYINSGLGNSWIEVSDAGVDIYTAGSISCHAEQDFNVRADRNINLDAGANVVVTAGGNIQTQSGMNTSMSAGGTLKLLSVGDMSGLSQAQLLFTATGNLQLSTAAAMTASASGDVNLKADGNMVTGAGGNHSTKAGTIIRQAGSIKDNSGAAPDPTTAAQATQPDAIQVTQQTDGANTVKTPVSRMPTHEPWKGHPKSKSTKPPAGQVASAPFSPNGQTDRTSPFKQKPGEGTSNQPDSTPLTTGDGKAGVIPNPSLSGNTSNINGFKIPVEVMNAIRKASSITGVDIGVLMAICATESGFNPNASARPASTADGLYQFLDGSWKDIIKRYPQYNITQSMKKDPEASALMGAAYAAENTKILQKGLGRTPQPTDIYMAHFMGPGGALKFLKADPTANARSVVPAWVVTSNPDIFKVSSTVQDVYDGFQKKIGGRCVAFAAKANSSGTATA
jgi:hypothetical protein